jgi:hypothetical protein
LMLESNGFQDCRICVLAPQEMWVGTGDAPASDESVPSNSVLPVVADLSLSRAPTYTAVAKRR